MRHLGLESEIFWATLSFQLITINVSPLLEFPSSVPCGDERLFRETVATLIAWLLFLGA
jgi:hypothetical protein